MLVFILKKTELKDLWCNFLPLPKVVSLVKTGNLNAITLLKEWRAIEFWFYLNRNFILKIEAMYGITRIIKSGCNLTAR